MSTSSRAFGMGGYSGRPEFRAENREQQIREVTQKAEEYNIITSSHNALIESHNALIVTSNAVEHEYNKIKADYNVLAAAVKDYLNGDIEEDDLQNVVNVVLPA